MINVVAERVRPFLIVEEFLYQLQLQSFLCGW